MQANVSVRRQIGGVRGPRCRQENTRNERYRKHCNSSDPRSRNLYESFTLPDAIRRVTLTAYGRGLPPALVLKTAASPYILPMVDGPDSQPKSRSFRQRYNEVEARRAQLVARLRALGETAQAHPGYKRALKLLNETFRSSKLAQRLAILQAAAWLIDILERLTEMM
jgi:hypothetical protein